MNKVKYQNNLELVLKYNQAGQTICQHQYTTYPLRLSSAFYLEGQNTNRAYCYLINTSPGLLAGDELSLSLQLEPNANIYLTDQAATKVHPMPEINTKAKIDSQIILNANTSLELVPEPVILYTDSVLEQRTTVKLHSTATFFISEIILPGRLAKQEYYDFNYYSNRLKIIDLENKLLFIEAMRLTGKQNQFKHKKLFTALPIIGSAIAIFPNIDLSRLISCLEEIEIVNNIEVATSILPSNQGIIIRALSNKTTEIKKYFIAALNCIRAITNQSPLPHIPK